MIAPGSLIGFALVFVFCTWGASVIAGLWLARSRQTLRAQGAGAERQAAALALCLPPLLGGALTLALAGFSVATPWLGFADHCESHGHHLHLCLFHGGAWAETTWALALILGLATIVAARLTRLAVSVWKGQRRLQIIERSSHLLWEDGTPVLETPSDRSFCFVAGVLNPRIFVASSLWARLSSGEQDAMLAHEEVHVENGDLWRSMLLTALALLGAPFVAARFKRLWYDATERYCDRLAADRLGSAESVAGALVNLARKPLPAGALSFLPVAESVLDRVIAVLSQERSGHGAAKRLARVSTALAVGATVASAVLADPLHHALETLFALI